jgi:predicted nuclease of predicted toxin-antitoxin system
MNLRQYTFLADENVHIDVIIHLRSQGLNVISVKDIGLIGEDDLNILRKANSEQRAIITHDSDFGTLAILSGEPVIGILYLRPGHINPIFTIGTLNVLFDQEIDVEQPFIIVAERTGKDVKIRVRKLGKQSQS